MADHPDLAHAVRVRRREWIVRHRSERRAHLQRRRVAKATHQAVEVARVGQQVELDDRLRPRVARGELDQPGLGVGLVDEGEQRTDLRTDCMPRRLAEEDDEHVAFGSARQSRGVTQRNLDVAPGVLIHASARADEG